MFVSAPPSQVYPYTPVWPQSHPSATSYSSRCSAILTPQNSCLLLPLAFILCHMINMTSHQVQTMFFDCLSSWCLNCILSLVFRMSLGWQYYWVSQHLSDYHASYLCQYHIFCMTSIIEFKVPVSVPYSGNVIPFVIPFLNFVFYLWDIFSKF